MSAQEQVERLRTLQESMHEIADKIVSLGDGSVMLADVAEGKKQIAEAINTKGGNSTPNESFQQLAEDISNLPVDYIIPSGYKYIGNVIPNNIGEVYSYRTKLIEINDNELQIIGEQFCLNCLSLVSARFNKATKLLTKAFYECSVNQLDFPELTEISGGNAIDKCSQLESINAPKLTSITGIAAINQTGLQTIRFDELVECSGSYCLGYNSKLENVILPKLQVIGFAILSSNPNLTEIVIGKLLVQQSLFGSTKLIKLRNITIGEYTDVNIDFNTWTPTNVIAEGQSGIDELNANLYNNLLTKLYDHSQDGQTRTLRIGWLAHVTQENIDYANSKGWTLTT